MMLKFPGYRLGIMAAKGIILKLALRYKTVVFAVILQPVGIYFEVVI